jgi:ribosomal protein S18 acetylase RimI-like enzyme
VSAADDDARRAVAFGLAWSRLVGTEVVPFRWGAAYLDDGFPLRYDSNFLAVEGRPADVTVDDLIAEADAILGGAGRGHRRILVEDELRVALTPGFLERGWSAEALAAMVLRGEPDRPRDTSAVDQLPFASVRDLLEEVSRREPWGEDAETVRQLTDHHAKLEAVAGARFFAQRVDGALAGSCELYVLGDEAQIENVATLEEYRRRGVASAVVLAAADTARSEGARWIHLVADAEDWPRAWYRRLGFVDAGGFGTFTLLPPTSTGAG